MDGESGLVRPTRLVRKSSSLSIDHCVNTIFLLVVFLVCYYIFYINEK